LQILLDLGFVGLKFQENQFNPEHFFPPPAGILESVAQIPVLSLGRG